MILENFDETGCLILTLLPTILVRIIILYEFNVIQFEMKSSESKQQNQYEVLFETLLYLHSKNP